MEQPERVYNYVVYKYTFPEGSSYVGVTTRTEPQRTAQHIWEALNTPDKGCIILNRAIVKYGAKSFVREIIFKGTGTQREMDLNEERFIAEHKTLTPNGYNIKSGGHTVPQTEEMIKKRSKSLRKKEGEKDLPMYTKTEMKRGTLIWRINNHPKCSSKSFKTKEDMLEFLAKLESGEIAPIIAKPKIKKDLPKYICERKRGYVIEIKGKYVASFLDSYVDKTILLDRAVLFLAEYEKQNII
jgi:hypothetical protein